MDRENLKLIDYGFSYNSKTNDCDESKLGYGDIKALVSGIYLLAVPDIRVRSYDLLMINLKYLQKNGMILEPPN